MNKNYLQDLKSVIEYIHYHRFFIGGYMVEEWKAVVYEDGFISQKYIVSDMGRIYNKVKGCLYDGSINSGGYKMVYLNEPGLAKPIRILKHRIVALAFIPNPDNLDEVNHKDGIKTNNKVENLEWITHRDNILHAHRTGLCSTKCDISDEDVILIRENFNKQNLSKMQYCKMLANKYGVSKAVILNILNNVTRYDEHFVPDMKHIIYNNSGINNYSVKLKEQDVIDIRNGCSNNVKQYAKDMAIKYNVSVGTITNIIYGYKWKSVGGKVRETKKQGKLTEYDVKQIREEFRNKSDDITVRHFCSIWANKKHVHECSIRDVIYNKSHKNIK